MVSHLCHPWDEAWSAWVASDALYELYGQLCRCRLPRSYPLPCAGLSLHTAVHAFMRLRVRAVCVCAGIRRLWQLP